MVTTMLENRDVMTQIKTANYDLMLTDPAMPGGVILAHYLQLPMVNNVRLMSFGEGHFSIAPSPISMACSQLRSDGPDGFIPVIFYIMG